MDKTTETNFASGLRALPSFPLVLVSVADNILTAAAFHFYSFNPPSVMVGIMPEKYTFGLIKEKKEFGINLPRYDQIEIVRTCGSHSGRDVNKYEKAGVTPFPGKTISSSLVRECPLNLECKVVHELNYPGSHQWFIGKISAVHRAEKYRKEEALMYWGGDYRKVGEFLEKR